MVYYFPIVVGGGGGSSLLLVERWEAGPKFEVEKGEKKKTFYLGRGRKGL